MIRYNYYVDLVTVWDNGTANSPDGVDARNLREAKASARAMCRDGDGAIVRKVPHEDNIDKPELPEEEERRLTKIVFHCGIPKGTRLYGFPFSEYSAEQLHPFRKR